MRTLPTFALVFLLAFIQATASSLPFTMVSLVLLAIYWGGERVFLLAFLAGIFLDVLEVRPVGSTSTIFLLTTLMISVYRRRFIVTNLLFVVISIFLSVLLLEGWRKFLP